MCPIQKRGMESDKKYSLHIFFFNVRTLLLIQKK